MLHVQWEIDDHLQNKISASEFQILYDKSRLETIIFQDQKRLAFAQLKLPLVSFGLQPRRLDGGTVASCASACEGFQCFLDAWVFSKNMLPINYGHFIHLVTMKPKMFSVSCLKWKNTRHTRPPTGGLCFPVQLVHPPLIPDFKLYIFFGGACLCFFLGRFFGFSSRIQWTNTRGICKGIDVPPLHTEATSPLWS